MNDTKNRTMNQEDTIEQLREKLRDSIDRVTRLYPNPRNRNEAVKGCLKRAQNLLTRARPKIEEFKNSIQELNNIADKEEKNQTEAKKQALELAEQEAKEYEKNVKNINNLDAGSIENLAKKAPDYKTKQNIFRPWWAEYNASKDIWEVDSNKLADEIIKSHPIKRLEENGFAVGLVVYLENLGNWARKSKAILNNFIEDAFQYPTDPIGKDSVQQTQYAKDLENAKSVKNTLTLLDGKIYSIDPENTFDTPPAHTIHFKTFDFNIDKWKITDFSREKYYLYSKDYNANTDTAQLDWDILHSPNGQGLIDSLAPITTEWLTKSLGAENEEKTLIAFMECIGLSLLNSYEIPFFVFIKSEGGHGKSALFKYLASLFGVGSTSGISLKQLTEGQAFDASELRFKEVNLVSDERATFVPDQVIGLLKSISGGDKKGFSQKNKQTASFTNHANLWFNMNTFPRFKTYDDAIARRACLFRWNYVAKYAHFNQEYLPTIKKERGEFALKCLYYAKIAIEREPIKYSYISIPIRLTRSNSMIKDYKEWADMNDYFNPFIENCCVIGKEYRIGTKFLLDKLNTFVKDNGGKSEYGMSTLGSRLQEKDVHKSDRPTSWKDEHGNFKTGTFVFRGITLKSIAKVEQEDKEFKKNQKKAGEQKWQAIING
ncbi:hypothetical protein CYJ79_05965 [Lactobacillus crispatus]|uniref:NrS-1 polymerase-like helicase domain-containing protein n=1 Tax=Lactobacillus crispatus TaxID=47770 RepID=A0A2N5KYD9_9LACO|nr:DUF5906 domain-containing protein [Lactobacillus crispatus]PLT11215.1 hypothetical protein CYJ79_05965 [Lactobacillus crispatus]